MEARFTRLGIKPQPMAVLAALADNNEVDDFGYGIDEDGDPRGDVDTFAWYNGRERGVSIVFENYDTPDKARRYLVVVVNEARGSDELIVDWWLTGTHYPNGPTPKYFPDEAYAKNRSHFPYMDVRRAVKKIERLTRKHARGALEPFEA